MDWTVNVEAAAPAGAAGLAAPDEAALDRLLDALADRAGVVAGGPGRYGARFDVAAATARRATAEALRVFASVAALAGLPDWPVVRQDVMTVAEQDAELARPTFPELVGVTEAAKLLRVSRQRVDQLAHREDFPAPLVTLAAGPIWLRTSIIGFRQRWVRKPGRPAKHDPQPVP